jgi:hypothetical protein
MSAKPKMHLVIPDCQVRPDVDYNHLTWIGNYIAEKRPDTVVCLGDFADMPSLSGYSVGKAEAEGRRYAADLAVARDGMRKLLMPVRRTPRARRPRLVLTLGNHEERIDREANANPKWKGFLSSADLGYREAGWTVVPYLKVAKLDGIEYSHFFISGSMGRPVSSAAALLRQRQCSAVMGHVQKVDLAIHPNTQHFGLFAGICYQHDEPYLTAQGNNTKRGVWCLHEIKNGTADPMFVSLDFLKRKYS